MHVLVTGAAGMLGARLAVAIARGALPVRRLTLTDLDPPEAATLAVPTRRLVLPLGDKGAALTLLADRPDVIFHLAAVVSSEAEADPAKGHALNVDATRALIDTIARMQGYCPRLVFASSLAVFGPPFPPVVPDDHLPLPASSYGTQKLIAEALVNDASRRGVLDGVSLRLPTICIRPGAPNRAASGFFSSILREPLAGLPAILPVPETLAHWFASPRTAIGFLLHASRLDTLTLGQNRALTLPGLTATVGDLLDALERRAGPQARALVRRVEDPGTARLVESWPAAFAATRARALGFRADTSPDELIDTYLANDAPAR